MNEMSISAFVVYDTMNILLHTHLISVFLRSLRLSLSLFVYLFNVIAFVGKAR